MLVRTALSRTALSRTALTAGLTGALLLPAPVAWAHGSPATGSSSQSSGSQSSGSQSSGSAVVAEASRHDGKDYRYGATGPDAFDCSGYVQYVFAQVGIDVPRTSGAQYEAAQPVARGAERPGDLIAIHSSSGRVSHVGIYAGDGAMWVASTGSDRVRLQSIYTDRYRVGRFG